MSDVITYKEISRKTGTSVASVSRFFSPSKMHLVGKKTREKIQALTDGKKVELNLAAQRLRTGKTNTITLFIPMMYFSRIDLYNDFSIHREALFSELIYAIRDSVKKYAYDLQIIPLLNDDIDDNIDDNILKYVGKPYSDAVILLWWDKQAELIYKRVKEKNVPCIAVSSPPLSDPDIPEATSDLETGYLEAAKYLTENNYNNIGYFKISKRVDLQDRVLNDSLEKVNLSAQNIHIPDEDALYSIVRKWGNNIPFDAIFCSNDSMAYRFIKALKHIGKQASESIGIIGMDDNPSLLSSEKITTIRIQRDLIGNAAVEFIMKTLDKKTPDNNKIYIPTTFIPRKSC